MARFVGTEASQSPSSTRSKFRKQVEAECRMSGMEGTSPSEPLDGNGNTKPSEDVFPFLEVLVPSELGVWGVMKEAYRLIAGHFDLFVLPMVLLALEICFVLAFHICKLVVALEWGISLGSVERDLVVGAVEYAGPYTTWIWVLAVVSVLLAGLAEAALDRGAVSACLKEVYREELTDEHKSSKALLVAGLRAIATNLAVLVTTAGLCILVWTVGYLVSAGRRSHASDVATLWVLIPFALLLYLWLTVIFIVAVPVSVVTRSWGFQAMYRSHQLTSGRANKLPAVLLALTGFALSLVNLGLSFALMAYASNRAAAVTVLVISAAWTFVENVFWFAVRIVFYLKLRACHKQPVLQLGV